MTIEWNFPAEQLKLDGAGLLQSDALRQTQTAAEIIRRLHQQPGVVLADEVGMGKTFVAFATAAAVIHSTGGRQGPVLFLVPSHMIDKWQDDWRKFAQRCVQNSWLTSDNLKFIDSVPALLRERDKPVSERAPAILMKLSTFTNRLQDPWFKLVIVQACFREFQLGPQVRKRFVKWAPDLLRAKGQFTSRSVNGLLRRSPQNWSEYLQEEKPDLVVPKTLQSVRRYASLEPLAKCLRSLFGSPGNAKLKNAKAVRRQFNDAIHSVEFMHNKSLDSSRTCVSIVRSFSPRKVCQILRLPGL